VSLRVEPVEATDLDIRLVFRRTQAALRLVMEEWTEQAVDAVHLDPWLAGAAL
jgi:hypothetical protein